MQRAAKTSRFLIGFFSNRGFADSEYLASNGDLFQYVLSQLAHTANSRQLFNELAEKLIRIAEHAYIYRDADTLQEVSSILTSLPMVAAQQVGKYYQALAIKRKKHANEAQSLLEAIAAEGQFAFRARAIQALGALHHDRGQPAEALRFHLEAVRAASDKLGCDLLATLHAHLEISHVQSDFGDHKGALATMERLSPLVHSVAKEIPFYLYGYQANLAYELSQVGRIAEAEAACALAMASPFAPAYPEWGETRDEIAAKRQSATPSVVGFNRGKEVSASPDRRPRRDVKPVTALAFVRLERGEQLSSSITVTAAAQCMITQRAQEFLCNSSQPRAPPALT